MKKNNLHKQAFTLIEMLISMTIFSFIMVSMMMIYATASNTSSKYEINREMRQNIKSVIEDISEEVRKNKIIGVKEGYIGDYEFLENGETEGFRLKVGNIEYRLGKQNNTLECSDIKNVCTLYKYENNTKIGPLTNSKLSFTKLKFIISGKNEIPKVSVYFKVRAAIKNGLRPDLIKNSEISFQTTFSERLLKIK